MKRHAPYFVLVLVLCACSDSDPPIQEPPVSFDPPPSNSVTYSEEREACNDRDPLRNPYFGDLHIHTSYSFDAYINETRPTPEEAYRFARGEPIQVPPLDDQGQGTLSLQLEQPIDFVTVTDHSEFLAEVQICITPGSPGYDETQCKQFRAGGIAGTALMGLRLTQADPPRLESLCGSDGAACDALIRDTWSRIVNAAEQAFDRSSACSLTTFVGYEWTGNTQGRNLHRNVIFRNGNVPPIPISYFEQSTPQGLWSALKTDCIDTNSGCDVLAIPHNSNLSNGGMFTPVALEGKDPTAMATLRAELEPLVEIFQHKGNSECNNGMSGILGEPDELCDVEQIRPLQKPPAQLEDCIDEIGILGIQGNGCVSRTDFVRGALLTGLQEEQRLGVNPMPLGIIASTDTHNAAPGASLENVYIGHTGSQESITAALLERQDLPFGLVTNPGGLAGVWAIENSRDAIFDALRRRETWGTSGTRLTVRFFGGWNYPETLCSDPNLVPLGYQDGVPMGGKLTARPEGNTEGPIFVVSAARDPSNHASDLSRIQIIKGWLGADGTLNTKVHTIEEAPNSAAATVDTATCATTGEGAAMMCKTWVDPDFDPALRAFYYARVVELPTCRWSQRVCLGLTGDARPEGCDDPNIPKTTYEMAWTSPIWYSP